MSVINQKEYLKKYLSSDPSKEKKKKRKKKLKGIIQNRVKIIDDDVDVMQTFTEAVKEDLAEDENAPQIVGIYDERPVDLRKEDFHDSSVWEVVDITNDKDGNPSNRAIRPIKSEPDSPTNSYSPSPQGRIHEKDYSPPRRQRRSDSNDLSPPRRRKGNIDNDLSPPRRKKDDDSSPPRRRKYENSSPPRKKRNEDLSPRRRRDEDSSPPRKRRDEESSPPRKRRDKDTSPPRRRRNEDLSPPRRRRNEEPGPRRRDEDLSPPRKRKNEDLSPPRRRRNEDLSPPRRKRNEDLSPRRKNDDSSPPRRRRSKSPPKNSKRDDSDRNLKSRKSRWEAEESSSSKMAKTLEGKRAGLQNAKDLAEETKEFKRKEDETFARMSEQVSGANARTIVRDRKTGKIRNLEEEAHAKEEQQRKQNEIKEKYDRWGKGLKQVADREEKLEADLHEMSKPLARYADDEDLENHLKNMERTGDPMLNYIRQKKHKERVETGKPIKPQYNGEFMPNRYGIPPGHRWDGVDRSNGYEKRWIDSINERTAMQNEAYKWNSEDM